MSDADGRFIEMAEDDQGEGVKDFVSELQNLQEKLFQAHEETFQEEDEKQEMGETYLDELNNENIKKQFEELVKKTK